MSSASPPNSDVARCGRRFAFVPTCDIERAGRPKEKAARRRLSILIIVDQAAIMLALTSDDGPRSRTMISKDPRYPGFSCPRRGLGHRILARIAHLCHVR